MVCGYTEIDIWIGRLLALQTIKHLQVPQQFRGITENFVRQCLKNDNKFVRAWADSGFFTLSRQFTDLAKEADLLMEAGLESEAPSVKAAIRKAKQGKKA